MENLTGRKFNRFTVIRFAGKSKTGIVLWECQCECRPGAKRIVAGADLKRGHSKSCGCHHREQAAEANRTHGDTVGKSDSPEYETWSNMIARCTRKNHPRYADYGGRGITVCKRWRKFEFFLADMGRKPTRKHTIERKDNDKNYCPSNCRWATKAEQNRNTRLSCLLTHDEKTLTLSQWAEITGMQHQTISSRKRRGWSDAEAVSIPVSPHNKIKSIRNQSMSGIACNRCALPNVIV